MCVSCERASVVSNEVTAVKTSNAHDARATERVYYWVTHQLTAADKHWLSIQRQSSAGSNLAALEQGGHLTQVNDQKECIRTVTP